MYWKKVTIIERKKYGQLAKKLYPLNSSSISKEGYNEGNPFKNEQNVVTEGLLLTGLFVTDFVPSLE